MHDLSIRELKEGLATKHYSSVELTEHFLKRIQQYDTTLNSFITVCEEEAFAQAKAADAARAAGKAHPLAGIPLAQKDIFCTQGVKTTCASKMLHNFIAPYNATTVEQFNHAHCVMLGKTNMDEFAMGSSNENSHYGPVKNPWNEQCVPGGSSGGSAAAVAARLTPVATGTDTGGSIRQPAALCGISGLKPTYGRVSRYGMVAFASSLDQGGLFARSAEDIAFLLEVMAGFDTKDSTSVDKPVPVYHETLNTSLQGLKIGIPKNYFGQGLDANIATAVQQAIQSFEQQGAILHEIELPNNHLSVPTYYVAASAECSSNLSRYDGVRFGYRCDNPSDLTDLYKRSRGEGFGAEVKRRIMVGTYALSAGYYDAYYLKAQQVRRKISDDFVNAFKEVDVIMGPTTPTTAFKIGEKMSDPVSMYLSDIYTIATNLAGLPGISIPCGFSEGLPIGLQITGPHFSEGKLLNIAHMYQRDNDWHQQQPAAFKN